MSDSVPLRRVVCAEEGCGLLTDTVKPVSCNQLNRRYAVAARSSLGVPAAGSLH